MELVCRRRDNCQKEASFGNYFLQLESSKNKDDRFSLHEDFMTCSCVCVRLYHSTAKASSFWNDVLDILEGTDQRSCVKSIILDTTAKPHHLTFCIYHISPPKANFRPIHNRIENDMIYCTGDKMIYIDIGYKSALMKSQRVTKRY